MKKSELFFFFFVSKSKKAMHYIQKQNKWFVDRLNIKITVFFFQKISNWS